MQIKHNAQAGSFESSDILVMVKPAEEGKGREVELESSVILQFGESIRREINKVLDEFKIKDIHIIAKDRGALAPTIASRVETAILRAMDKR